MQLEVGSQALINSGVNLKRRIGKDIDLLVDTESAYKIKASYINNDVKFLMEKKYGFAVEIGDLIFEYDYRPTTQNLLEILKSTQIDIKNVCYTLKMSHRYLKNSPHFLKTMHDIHILRSYQCEIPDVLKEWFKERERETYFYKHPKLNQKKDDFFNPDDGVIYKYDHDSIHQAVALFDRPAYTYYKDDQAEVWCSSEKFFNLQEEIRLAGVYEESAVLALERCLIPFDFNPSPTQAFKKALEKVCTSITSGWFRKYAWENYYKVYEMHRNDPMKFVDNFYRGLKEGVVNELQKSD